MLASYLSVLTPIVFSVHYFVNLLAFSLCRSRAGGSFWTIREDRLYTLSSVCYFLLKAGDRKLFICLLKALCAMHISPDLVFMGWVCRRCFNVNLCVPVSSQAFRFRSLCFLKLSLDCLTLPSLGSSPSYLPSSALCAIPRSPLLNFPRNLSYTNHGEDKRWEGSRPR